MMTERKVEQPLDDERAKQTRPALERTLRDLDEKTRDHLRQIMPSGKLPGDDDKTPEG